MLEFPMTVESLSYSLSLGGKAVGTQLLQTATKGPTTTLEARALWQGVFGQQSISQKSQLLSTTGESLRFSEESVSKSEKHLFEVVFDAKAGLIRATRKTGNGLERAETPYLRPHSDPLGLLQTLRTRASESYLRIALLGKDVVAERLADSNIETGLGTRRAHTFVLYPGPAYVYLATDEPHIILRLIQPTTSGLLEAQLVRVAYEEGTLSAKTSETPSQRPNRRRRGGRRRKRTAT